MSDREFRLWLTGIWSAAALAVAGILLGAYMARAVNDWGFTGCSSDSSTLGDSGTICFDFTNAITGGAGALVPFSVSAGSALACFDPNIATSGVSTAGGVVWYCPTGDADVNVCVQVCAQAGCALTGLQGAPATQLSCVTLGRGSYLFEVDVLPAGGQTGLFSVQGGN